MPDLIAGWWQIPGLRALVLVAASVLVGWLAELLLKWLTTTLARRTRSTVDDKILTYLRGPLLVSVILVGIGMAGAELGLAPRTRFALHGVLGTIAVLVWTLAAMRIGVMVLRSLSRRAAPRAVVKPRTLPVFDFLLKLVVAGLGAYFLLVAWAIDPTAWLASAGIVGIAIGFAAKDTLANLFSGIFILADAPYKLGDYIVVDRELRGEVSAIGFRSTRILTRDDIEITIPNSVIAAARIVNESGGPHARSRIRLALCVEYGSDLERLRELLLGCVSGIEHVCDEPGPAVRFRELGELGIKLELLCWIDNPAMRGRVFDALILRVYKALAEAGIRIPSSRDVLVREWPAPPGLPDS